MSDSPLVPLATKLGMDMPRYAVRSALAGAYLTLGTALAATVGTRVEALFPGLGMVVFAFLFFIGLASIMLLSAELATGNMMYFFYGIVHRKVGLGRALWLLVVCTLLNLIGAILVAVALHHSTAYGNVDGHLITTIAQVKMNKSLPGLFIEAMVANFVVNMGIIGALRIPEWSGKLPWLMCTIAIFVGLGTEHIIANFAVFSLAGLSTEVLVPWLVVWCGNLVGGGILLGAVYAWLDR